MNHEIILHIGMNKTGSSAIQYYFTQNYEAFLRNGLLYPQSGRNGHAHHYLSRLLGFGPSLNINDVEKNEAITTLRQSLISEINKNAVKKTIISSEFFITRRKLKPVTRFFRDFNLKILVYLRRHDHWYESAYTQGPKTVVKPPWGKGMDDYLVHKRKKMEMVSYRRLLEKWAEFFGKDNIIVRPYESIQNQPDLISDFIEHAGLSAFTANIRVYPRIYNQKPGPLGLKILETIQPISMPKWIRKKLVNVAMKLPRPAKKQSLLSPATRRLLIEENMDDYCYIAREYLGREDGRLFYDSSP